MTRDTHTIWICEDCMMLLANGEVRDDCEQPPMQLLEGEEVTPGLMADEHHEDCDLRNSTAARDTAVIFNVDVEENSEIFDCNLDCENRGFSHATCDGCGGLPGDRFAATLWTGER